MAATAQALPRVESVGLERPENNRDLSAVWSEGHHTPEQTLQLTRFLLARSRATLSAVTGRLRRREEGPADDSGRSDSIRPDDTAA